MTTQNTLEEIASVLNSASRIAVVSHYSPDPDAYGSSCALTLALKALGKDAVTLNQDGILPHFCFIPGVSEIQSALPAGDWDLLVVVDCGELGRVGDDLAPTLSKVPTVINIDHHASNHQFGRYNHVVESVTSTAELIFKLLKIMGTQLTPDIASCLFAGICSDTGSFRRSAKSGETFAIAGALVAAGADPNALGFELFDRVTLGGLRLQGAVLAQTELIAEGKVAQVKITREMCERHGVTAEEAKELVTRILGVEGVKVAIIIREDSPLWRVSLRSVAASYDVSAVAQSFGGGGHRQAAAFRSKRPLEEFYPKLKSELERVVAAK